MISYLYSFNPRVGINENCKYFIAALIFNNIESGHPRWTPHILMAKDLDKETIYFNFRLDIGITKFNDMDEFVSVTKHCEGQRRQNPNPSYEKESNEMTANRSLSVLDINYVTYSRKYVQYSSFSDSSWFVFKLRKYPLCRIM